MIGYAIFGMGSLIVLLLTAILARMILSGQPAYTKETNNRIEKELEAQAQGSIRIGEQLHKAGWWNKRTWRKKLGPELYDHYITQYTESR